MPFTTENWVGFSLHLCKCGWDFLFLLLYFPRPPVKEKGKSICFLLELPISNSLNFKETVLPPTCLLSQEREVSSSTVAPAVDKLITHKNITELRALKTPTF